MSESPEPGRRPEVLIVGAGPVGLTLAVALGQRGIRCQLAERSAQPGILPKMDLSNPRTMEIFGRMGLAEKIRLAGWPLDARFDVHVGPSLTAPPYAVLTYPSIAEMQAQIAACHDGSEPREPYERISQYNLEALLRSEAEALPGVQVCFDRELVLLEQTSSGVLATLRSRDGATRTVRAPYLVGCDGGNSKVRELLNIQYAGAAKVARNYMVFFRCPDLLERTGLKPFRHFYLAGDRQASLVAQDDLKRWSLHVQIGHEEDASKLDPLVEVRAALGLDLQIEVLHAGAWTPHLLVAQRYRDRRIFLAGDAVHQYIPTGGFGMNTGVAEADNLAWKLAAILRGWGGPKLLDSYEDERLPVAQRNCRAAEYAAAGARTWREFFDPSVLEDTEAGRERRRLLAARINLYQRRSHEQRGTELGYRYTHSAICLHETGPQTDPDSPVYCPSSTPGARLPHAWVEPGRSVHDLAGSGMTLLSLGSEIHAVQAFEAAAQELGVPLEAVRLQGRDDLRALYGASMLLLRPDLHVAWRGDAIADAKTILAISTGH